MKTIHGHGSRTNRSTEYSIWAGMRKRCLNPKFKGYKNYGGRGITVCSQWNSFTQFLIDMGCRPEGCCLDRIDNDKNYCKENCRWVTYTISAENRRSTRFITFKGETYCVARWAEKLGISHYSMRYRLKKFTLEEALTSPKGSLR